MKKFINYAFLVFFTLFAILPFYVIVMMATHSTAEIFSGKLFSPGNYFWANMKTIFINKFHYAYYNSIIVSTISTVICVFISALTGYALAKYRFKLRNFLFFFILMIMMLPGQIGLIGYVLEMKALGLNNTLAPLILIWCISAFGVFFMVQYIKETLPDEMIESARIDGCSEFGIFIRIVLPFIKPATTTLATLIFLWSWNYFLLPTIIIYNRELYTIPLGIQALQNTYFVDFGAQGAGLAFAVVPILIIFSLGSKTFIKGLTAGAIKG
jgi:cellobiose transport system permease protein